MVLNLEVSMAVKLESSTVDSLGGLLEYQLVEKMVAMKENH
jgi:hypothetical protein